MSFRPNQRRRRWFTALLLSVYGAAGVLGYGLHAVGHCHHCHDVAETLAHCHDSDHCDHETSVTDDDCSICAFLAQAQTEQVYEPPVLRTAISSADPPQSEISDVPNLVRLHLARGPPLV